jgi:hypothetical protein
VVPFLSVQLRGRPLESAPVPLREMGSDGHSSSSKTGRVPIWPIQSPTFLVSGTWK